MYMLLILVADELPLLLCMMELQLMVPNTLTLHPIDLLMANHLTGGLREEQIKAIGCLRLWVTQEIICMNKS
jgi:hypothetical protein